MQKYWSKNWVCCACIGFLALLLWAPSIRYHFVWDDDILVLHDRSIRSAGNIPRFFWRRDLQSSEDAPSSYRPVRNSIYTILYALDGKDTPQPWIFHLNNVLWHSLAAMLLFQVALLLWARLAGAGDPAARTAAFLVSLGFAVHPVLSEVVCYVKCLDDLLAAVFVLASARSLLQWNGRWPGYTAALVWFLLASFSKESAVPFAVVVFFLFYGFQKVPWRRSLALTIPFLLTAFFYAAVRHLIMGRSTQYVPLSGSYGQTLTDMFPVVTDYARLLCGIPPFCADYNFMVSQPPWPFLSGAVLGGLFLALLVCGLAVWLWLRPGWRLAGFGLGWLSLFLLPVSNLLPMMQYMADRFLYLPLMGFLFALAAVMLKVSRPRLAGVAALGILVLWTVASLERMGIWRDELTLFVQTDRDFPGSPRQRQNAVSAIFHLPQMMPLFPDYLKTGSWKPAEKLRPAEAGPIIATLQQARQLFPGVDTFSTELALVEAKTGRWPEAVVMAEMATRQNPGSSTNYFTLARLCFGAGQPEKARTACAQALRLQPDFAQAKALQSQIESQWPERHDPGAPASK